MAVDRRAKHRERGVIMVYVAMALFALLGAAALAIDIGRLVVGAQVAQNTVDAAALAGVSQLPELTEATTETGFCIEANNEGGRFDVALSSENGIVHWVPGETVEGYGQLPDDEYALRVTGQVEVSYIFAPALGLESATVTRSATALQLPGDMPTTVFAHHENEHAIIFSGDDLDITGLVHSNGGIDVNGINALFHDPVEYFNILRDPSGTTTYEAGYRQHDKREWPIDYTASDFEPYDHIIDGNWEPTQDNLTLAPGNYFVNGSVKIKGNFMVAEDCTIVATGSIHLAGDAPKFTPHDKNVALYSLLGDIYTTAPGSEVDGILFAPTGHIDYLGDGQRTVSLIAQTVAFWGNTADVTGIAGTSLIPKVRLIQ